MVTQQTTKDSFCKRQLLHSAVSLLLNSCSKDGGFFRRRYEEAIEYHKKALALIPKNASTFSSIGYNYMLMWNFHKAVEYFHKALSIKKNDSFTTEMLKSAVDEIVTDISGEVKGMPR